jgi:hypothetical protein
MKLGACNALEVTRGLTYESYPSSCARTANLLSSRESLGELFTPTAVIDAEKFGSAGTHTYTQGWIDGGGYTSGCQVVLGCAEVMAYLLISVLPLGCLST